MANIATVCRNYLTVPRGPQTVTDTMGEPGCSPVKLYLQKQILEAVVELINDTSNI